MRARLSDASGQALVLTLGLVAALLTGGLVLVALGEAVGAKSREQRAADLAAVSAAAAMRRVYPRLFEPAVVEGRRNPRHLARAEYLRRGRAAAREVAERNGAREIDVEFPDGDEIAPVRIRVTVSDPAVVKAGGRRAEAPIRARAEAELAPPGGGLAEFGSGGGYSGPLAYRQGKPMRPDVALAFDRMAAAASHDGVALVVNSAFRSDAEQAVLFARHPDPKWVAPPGRSLHRLATELDLGPPGAYGWLASHAGRFGFVQRYSWEWCPVFANVFGRPGGGFSNPTTSKVPSSRGSAASLPVTLSRSVGMTITPSSLAKSEKDVKYSRSVSFTSARPSALSRALWMLPLSREW